MASCSVDEVSMIDAALVAHSPHLAELVGDLIDQRTSQAHTRWLDAEKT